MLGRMDPLQFFPGGFAGFHRNELSFELTLFQHLIDGPQAFRAFRMASIHDMLNISLVFHDPRALHPAPSGPFFSRLLKNAHLLRFPHPSSLRRTSQYASFLRISGLASRAFLSSLLTDFTRDVCTGPFVLGGTEKLAGRAVFDQLAHIEKDHVIGDAPRLPKDMS